MNLRKRIALGDGGCEVAIYFKPTEEEVAITALNNELRKSDEMVIELLKELERLREEVEEMKGNVSTSTS